MLLWPLAIGIGIAMTFELKMLALSIVLGLIQIVLASHAASLQRGYVWTASSRDEAVSALTGVADRLARALQNFFETFPLFAAAVLIAYAAATHSWMTEWGVQLYFWGRVVYLALYAAGIFLLRSLVWNIATLGIVLVLLSLNHNSTIGAQVLTTSPARAPAPPRGAGRCYGRSIPRALAQRSRSFRSSIRGVRLANPRTCIARYRRSSSIVKSRSVLPAARRRSDQIDACPAMHFAA